MNPQIYGYFLEKALAAGALDVFSAPVQMKKNRPRHPGHASLQARRRDKFEDMLFVETTTLGVRGYTAERRVLARQWESVHTRFGDVRIKVARLNGHVPPGFTRI